MDRGKLMEAQSSAETKRNEDSMPVRIVAKDLGKTYRLYDAPSDRLLEMLTRQVRHQDHHALEGVNFELRAGETLGVVGQNGAGKSTLLQLLAGVLQPTHGELSVDGTVSSILELGAGFHPEFTGRQNIRINAAMLGLDERQLEQRLPSIEEFCELGDFLDQPVKFYSSGMAMRLAFAIATQVEPEILIIDEALSVGDGYFQKKCMDRIMELIDSGAALLFCSHSMYYVSTLCHEVIWLQDGKVAASGPAEDVVRLYEDFLIKQQAAMDVEDNGLSTAPTAVDQEQQQSAAAAAGVPRLSAVSLRHQDRELSDQDEIAYGADLNIHVAWTTERKDLEFQIAVGFDRVDGVQVFGIDTREHTRVEGRELCGQTSYSIQFEIASQPLLRGEYTVHVFLLDEKALHVYDHRILQGAVRVTASSEYEVGLIRVPATVVVE